jgi:hypothetical protein
MKKVLVPIFALAFAAMLFVGHAGHTFADPRDFRFQNASPVASVVQLFVDTTGPGDYGSDLLSGATVAPGESGTVRFNQQDAGQCVFDILAVFDDGSQREFTGIDLCATASVTVS